MSARGPSRSARTPPTRVKSPVVTRRCAEHQRERQWVVRDAQHEPGQRDGEEGIADARDRLPANQEAKTAQSQRRHETSGVRRAPRRLRQISLPQRLRGVGWPRHTHRRRLADRNWLLHTKQQSIGHVAHVFGHSAPPVPQQQRRFHRRLVGCWPSLRLRRAGFAPAFKPGNGNKLQQPAATAFIYYPVGI